MAQAIKDALTRMLERSGMSRADFRCNSRVGRLFRRSGVQRTAELDRVRRLPARTWTEDPHLERMRADVTDWLRTASGLQLLRPVQVKALEELHDFGGGLLQVRVGGGKTLISYLGGTVSGLLPALLVVPGKLRGKTLREFKALRAHWSAIEPAILSYEEISRDGGYEKLVATAPRLIILDECHRAKNKDAGVTRKLLRYHREHPECRLLAMSGTTTTRSLREYAHLAEWALGELCPVPRQSNILSEWADALDEKVPAVRRMAPGALLGLCDETELDRIAKDANSSLETVRCAYRRRLVSTPAMIATEERALGTSLLIEAARPIPGPPTWPAFATLRSDWETPDGHPFTEASELWRHARELSCGFYYVWDPPAPRDWLDARRDWSRFVREQLCRRLKGVDTELQVANACDAGRLPSETLEAWRGVRDTFKPNSVPVWIDGAMIDWCIAWLAMRDGPAIVWTEHVAFGQRLAKDGGLRYFGRQGRDDSGTPIEELEGSAHVVASIQSCGEGLNLQAWSRNLIVSAPPNGRIWEQMIGRTHREGQQEDEVSATVCLACIEQWKGMRQAIADAHYVEQTTGQPQKLLYADWEGMPTDQEVAALQRAGDPMWRD